MIAILNGEAIKNRIVAYCAQPGWTQYDTDICALEAEILMREAIDNAVDQAMERHLDYETIVMGRRFE